MNEACYELPGQKQQGNFYYILTLDHPPLKWELNRDKTRTYIIRRAAWEALRQMGEQVDPPEFNAN